MNQYAIIDYLIYGYSDSDSSVWKNIMKLSPGHYIKISEKNFVISSFIIEEENNFYKNKNDAKIDLREAIINDIESQLASDVPLGIFLSGGIDSSIILGS